jgi:hypothetical protein
MAELSEPEPPSFPQRLIKLLEDKEVQESIHWVKDGRSIRIHNPELFQSTVLKKYFNSIQLDSFITRLVSKFK